MKITNAGRIEVSCEVNFVASSDAFVDSAEVGKKPALSFC
jgi:translation elongation factor EF-Ts